MAIDSIPARQRIISASLNLFHKQGVAATSVDEILELSGTGKSQFYHYFKNKDDLIHHVLLFFYDALRAGKTPIRVEIETWDDLEVWFEAYQSYQTSARMEKSCPVATIGNELSNDQELPRQDVRLIFEFVRRSLVKFFVTQKAKNELPASADPEGLAGLCFVVMQGGLLVSKIERDPRPFATSVAQLMSYLKQLRTSMLDRICTK